MSQVIMFDYDGVIVDSFEAFSDASVAAFRAVGLPQYATRDAVLAFHEQNWFEGLAAAGIPGTTAQRIEDLIADACEGDPDLRPFPDIPEVIAALAEQCTLFVITSSRTRVVEAFLSANGIHGITRVIGSDTETSKVARIATVVADHGPDAEYWYIGDTVGDIAEGREAGVRTIAATWGWHDVERLRAAGPDVLAQTPRALLDVLLSPRR